MSGPAHFSRASGAFAASAVAQIVGVGGLQPVQPIAGTGLAPIGIENAHEHVGLAVGRLFQHDQLVAAHAQTPVGDDATTSQREIERDGTRIEHDEVIAQPMHL